jgi:beta-galactosidase
VLQSLTASVGVKPPFEVPAGVELTVRRSGDKQWIYLMNHTATTQNINLLKSFRDFVTGDSLARKVNLNGYEVRLLQAV